MKLITFKDDRGYKVGALISDDQVVDLTTRLSDRSLTATEVSKCFDLDSGFFEKATEAIKNNNTDTVSLNDITVAASVPAPGKIICIGLNYRDHAEESGMAVPTSPVIFSKFSSCIIGHNERIRIPTDSLQSDYEAELAVVVGRTASNIHVRRRDELRLWLRKFQRCERSRFSVRRQPVAERQIVRHFRPDRSVYRNGG